MVAARDGPQAPTIRTQAELEALVAEMVRRDPQPDAWEGRFLLRLGSRGRFAFHGPMSYRDASPVRVSGTWHLMGCDVVLSPARVTPDPTRPIAGEIVCHLDDGRLYFPWGEPALLGQELVLVKR
jgi:hypothetical protein